MVDANNTVECRYIADRDDWQSWQVPSDKGNSRAQLRRIVDEWQQQKKILSDLANIHPDIYTALAKALQAYELVSRATVSMTVAAPAAIPHGAVEESPEFDFEESVEC